MGSVSDGAVGQQERLKICLVISGAIALGSYESGVICELTRAARAKNGPIAIDVIAGTSAGSITGAQVAKVLVTPRPNFDIFKLWAEATLSSLVTRTQESETSPLSQSWARTQMEKQLAGTDDKSIVYDDTGATYELGDAAQDVRLVITLTDLEGNAHETSYGDGISVPAQGCWNSVTVTTAITPKTTAEQWKRIGNLALASSAHSLAWEAVQIHVPDRHIDGNEIWEPKLAHQSLLYRQRRNGADPFFADGGTVASANLPIGRGLRMLSRKGPEWKQEPQAPYDPHRLVLYVQPDPDEKESEGRDYRKWLNTLVKAGGIYLSTAVPQSDLKWVGETNHQIVEIFRLVARVWRDTYFQSDQDAEDSNRLAEPMAPLPFSALPKAAIPKSFRQQAAIGHHAPEIELGSLRSVRPAEGEAVVDAAVEAFYTWLKEQGKMGNAGTKPDEALAHLKAALERSPLHRHLTTNITHAILDLAELYYHSLCYGSNEQVEAMKGLHSAIARHTPAGGRQWVAVNRIVPGRKKPFSRYLGHFGGFFNQEWMQHDFVLGRRDAIEWLRAMFRNHPYYEQIALDPVLPRVKHEQMEPVLIARNVGALCEAAAHVLKSLREAVPWLSDPIVRWAGHILFTVVSGSTVVYWLDKWTWLDRIQAFLRLGGLGFFDVSAIAVVGALLAWLRTLPPLSLTFRLAVIFWAAVSGIKGMWGTTKAALEPGLDMALKAAASKQSDEAK